MPTSFVRLIVAGLTLVLAVLTGLVTGFVAGGPGCDEITPTSTVSTGPASTGNGPANAPAGASPSASGDINKGELNPGGNDSRPQSPKSDTGKIDQPGINESLTLTGATADCSGFSALTAVFGFLGALFTGAIVGGVALFLPRTDAPAPVAAGSGGLSSGAGYGAGGGRSGDLGVGQPLVGRSTATGTHAVLTETGAPAETGLLRRERKTLVETCIYVRDRATSKAIADRLAWALNEVGVVEDRPAGEPFDTARHEAGGTTPTADQAMAGRIAAVEISGYTDRGQVLRAPVVTVYQPDAR
ncbi:nucleotide exchange factor GrpE [Cryptosporangium sp. NPDC051539]|uniref:nucleotide exchange factor GrpE n=1 Tax=Cryptosporangium sp. NPDC051539 TaxID=3363962 RepID=UPI0037B3CE73